MGTKNGPHQCRKSRMIGDKKCATAAACDLKSYYMLRLCVVKTQDSCGTWMETDVQRTLVDAQEDETKAYIFPSKADGTAWCISKGHETANNPACKHIDYRARGMTMYGAPPCEATAEAPCK